MDSEISMTRVESPLPVIDFDGIWQDAVERYQKETVIKLPDVYEDCTTPKATLDLIHKRYPDFPMKFAIPRENGRIFRELLTELLELLHNYATCVWPEEGKVGAARFRVFFVALIDIVSLPKRSRNSAQPWYYSATCVITYTSWIELTPRSQVPKDKFIVVGDYLYAIWKLMMRTKPYVEGEIEIETQEELARTLGELLVTIGFASPRIKVGTLSMPFLIFVIPTRTYVPP